jgi:hypothetical protein
VNQKEKQEEWIKKRRNKKRRNKKKCPLKSGGTFFRGKIYPALFTSSIQPEFSTVQFLTIPKHEKPPAVSKFDEPHQRLKEITGFLNRCSADN